MLISGNATRLHRCGFFIPQYHIALIMISCRFGFTQSITTLPWTHAHPTPYASVLGHNRRSFSWTVKAQTKEETYKGPTSKAGVARGQSHARTGGSKCNAPPCSRPKDVQDQQSTDRYCHAVWEVPSAAIPLLSRLCPVLDIALLLEEGSATKKAFFISCCLCSLSGRPLAWQAVSLSDSITYHIWDCGLGKLCALCPRTPSWGFACFFSSMGTSSYENNPKTNHNLFKGLTVNQMYLFTAFQPKRHCK